MSIVHSTKILKDISEDMEDMMEDTDDEEEFEDDAITYEEDEEEGELYLGPLGDFGSVARIVTACVRLLASARRKIAERKERLRVRLSKLRALSSLYELLQAKGNDRNVNAISNRLVDLAPSLVGDLKKASRKRIATHVEMRLYSDGDLVFREGDRPTGFFFILTGSVGVYKQPQAAALLDEQVEGDDIHTTKEQEEKMRRQFSGERDRVEELGPRVAELKHDQGFGSLAFSRNGKGLRRTASIVAQYAPDEEDELALQHSLYADAQNPRCTQQSRGTISPTPPLYTAVHRSRPHNRWRKYPSRESEHSAQEERQLDPRQCCAMILIPNKVYVTDISKTVDATLQRKIALLENSLIFESWPIERVYSVAHEMTFTAFEANEMLCVEDEPCSNLFMLTSGEVHVRTKVCLDNKDGEEKSFSLDVALLQEGEIFGMVESIRRTSHYRATVTASKRTEVAIMPLDAFRKAVLTDERSTRIVNAIVANREQWEAMRKGSITHFKDSPPLSLSLETTAAARYLIEPSSVLGAGESRDYNLNYDRFVQLNKCAAWYVREAADRWKGGRPLNSKDCLIRAADVTNTAIRIASHLRDSYGHSSRVNKIVEELTTRRDRVRERLYTLESLGTNAPALERSRLIENEHPTQDEFERKKPEENRVQQPLKSGVMIHVAKVRAMARHARAVVASKQRRVRVKQAPKGLTTEKRVALASIVTATDIKGRFATTAPKLRTLRKNARELELSLREADSKAADDWLAHTRSLAHRAKRNPPRHQPQRNHATRPATDLLPEISNGNKATDDASNAASIEKNYLYTGSSRRLENHKNRRASIDSCASSLEIIEKSRLPTYACSTVAAAFGAACADVDSLPAVAITAPDKNLRCFLRKAFEEYGCLVDEERRGMATLDRLQRFQLAGRPYTVAIFAPMLAGGLRGITAALRHRAWEAAMRQRHRKDPQFDGDTPPIPQKLAVFVDPEAVDERRQKRDTEKAQAMNIIQIPAMCTVRDVLRLVCDDDDSRLLEATRKHRQYHLRGQKRRRSSMSARRASVASRRASSVRRRQPIDSPLLPQDSTISGKIVQGTAPGAVEKESRD